MYYAYDSVTLSILIHLLATLLDTHVKPSSKFKVRSLSVNSTLTCWVIVFSYFSCSCHKKDNYATGTCLLLKKK